ncbi:MAG TPA: hypothetical protein VE220_06210 [Gaiellaceae bacterium]|nr:hypothetical protein [Gaiellaceae bacterium]
MRRQVLAVAHPHHEHARGDEADGVGEDRVRRGQDRDQTAGEAGACDLRDAHGQLQLRVPVDQVLSLDQRREVRLIRDVEENGEDADRELQDEELPHPQLARRPEDRDQREQHRARGVADDP